MFISRNRDPVFEAVNKVTDLIVGPPTVDMRLVRVIAFLMPDGRIYYGSGTPEFVQLVKDRWESDLTEEQVRRYSIPEIQWTAVMMKMYPQDYEQIQSFPEDR